MSHDTPHHAHQGNQQRRRSRGGKGRNKPNNNRNSPSRTDEFRPSGHQPRSRQGNQYPKKPKTLLQKILGFFGIGKKSKAPAKSIARPERKTVEPVAPKNNTRNARSNQAQQGNSERPARTERPTGRGGKRESVESPRVYIGNLSYDTSEQDLQELFNGIGKVRSVEIVYNRNTHRSKGYGFVEMLNMEEAIRAVEVLHDQFFMGRKITVSGAKSKEYEQAEAREQGGDQAEAVAKPIVVAPLPVEAPAVIAAAPVTEIATVIETENVSTEEEAVKA